MARFGDPGDARDGDWFPVYDHTASREDRKFRESVARAGDGVKALSPWVYIGVESGASVHTRQPFPLRPRFDPRRGASFRSVCLRLFARVWHRLADTGFQTLRLN